jgi:hypothetical protein
MAADNNAFSVKGRRHDAGALGLRGGTVDFVFDFIF